MDTRYLHIAKPCDQSYPKMGLGRDYGKEKLMDEWCVEHNSYWDKHKPLGQIDRCREAGLLGVRDQCRTEKEHESCPHCGADLQGGEIPVENRSLYGGLTHYSRKIGVYDSNEDRTVEWQCPDCGKRWGRDGTAYASLRVTE